MSWFSSWRSGNRFWLDELREISGKLNRQTISLLVKTQNVLDALACLFCRSSLSAEMLWAGGWLLRQLPPHGAEEFTTNQLKQLKDSHKGTTTILSKEIKGSWCDMILSVLRDE